MKTLLDRYENDPLKYAIRYYVPMLVLGILITLLKA
jgi:hypothetical protein